MGLVNVVVERDGPIVTLKLNRPERMNALSIEMARELAEACQQVGGDPDARVLVVTGSGGRAFSAGMDLADMTKREAQETAAVFRLYLDCVLALRNLPIPVIAQVNGVAAGGGACLCLACDLRVASEEARFGFVFVHRGLSGADMGATYYLPRLVGFGRACELLLTGEMIDAQEAHAIGLVNYVVPARALEGTTQALASRLAAGPPIALRLTKRALHEGLDKNLSNEFDYETYAQTMCMLSEDHQEGVLAFREKRAPRFRGR